MRQTNRREFLAATLGLAVAARFAAAAQSDDPASLTLKQASEQIRSKKVSPVELTEVCLSRIKIYSPKMNAFITVMGEKAREQARQLEKEQAAGRFRSPLHGIPLAIKDNIDTAGTRTTAGSAVFEDRVPAEDAEVVRRLREAGAILIGKANMHEFAAGGTSAVSYWGPVRNPWNLERYAGGSSGGSAVSVAMDLCYGALGTDTGGSIRTPSAHCGVVGLKPTYGRVSIRGIVPLTWSLDHCGPIARTVEDAAMILQQIAGYDELDIYSEDHPVANYAAAIGSSVSNFRIGIPPRYFDNVEPDVRQAVEDAIAVLGKMTRGSQEVNLPAPPGGQLGAEGASYHIDLHAPANLYMNGRGRTASDESVGDYVRSWRELQLLRRTVDDAFRDIDVVVTPTRRRTAKSIADELRPRPANAPAPPPDPENTRPFDAYGIPAISVPCGFDHDGMPIGLQIAAAHWNEEKVIALAHAFQEATEWHKRRPPLQPDTKVPADRR